MKDLLVLVADSQMDGVVSAVLDRPEALGIRRPSYRTIVHPGKDPGVVRDGSRLLADSLVGERHALVLMDLDGSGTGTRSAADVQEGLERNLAISLPNVRSRAIVMDPELDVWMWATDQSMREAIGWTRSEPIREWASRELGISFDERGKPVRTSPDTGPKEALEGVLRRLRVPRSRALYADIARGTSLPRCADPAFVRLRETLQGWFEPIEGRDECF